MTTHILRCRITAHHHQDREYNGTAKDFARVLAEHEASVAAIKETGADVILEDARPVNVRNAVPAEPPAAEPMQNVINASAVAAHDPERPAFMTKAK